MLAPVSGLSISKSMSGEFRVDNFTFVTGIRLQRCRKRLGLPIRASELFSSSTVTRLFDKNDLYAIGSKGGKGLDAERDLTQLLQDELDILALSQLGYNKRRFNARLSASNENFSGNFKRVMINVVTKAMNVGWQLQGKHNTLDLDSRWQNYQRSMFFMKLLSVLRGDCSVSEGWRKDIRNAAILAGQSQASSDLANAFLWNMISLETLLTSYGDSYSSMLPKRVEAFIGWSTKWSVDEYHDKIVDVYKKRCAMVHAGRRDEIQISDLLFTDDILLNVLANVINNIDLFRTKEDLIKFSERVQAEQVLGVKGKVQPKKLTFISRNYQSADLEQI